MIEWEVKTLDSVVELRRGFDLPHHSRRAGPFPVLTSGATAGWHEKGPIKGPGFAIGRATNLGEPTWSDVDFWPLNTTLYVADFRGNVPRWAFHLFESLDLSGYDSGSVQPMLNRNYIAKVKVLVPPFRDQRAIAEVLGALDDKLAANTELVTASARLASVLFSSSLEDGAITSQLSDLVVLLARGITPSYTDDDHALVILNQKCVRGQRVDLAPARRTERTKARAEKRLVAEDVLVNSTGQGTLGRVARWTVQDEATVDSHMTIVRFDPSKLDPTCGGFAMLALQPQIEAMGEGSTGQTELSRIELGRLSIKVPHLETARRIGERLRKMSAMENAVLMENRTLAAIRNALLPQLMSGKLRVKDAEKALEGVL